MRGVLIALGGLLLASCALTTPRIDPSPTLEAWRHLAIRETAGLYTHGDWDVEGDSLAPQLARLEAWAQAQGYVVAVVQIADKELLGHVLHSPSVGWVILIDSGESVNLRFFTLLHEIGHIYTPGTITVIDDEVFVELAAAQVCEGLGVNVWPQTAAYLQRRATVEEQARAVYRWAREIDAVVKTLKAAVTKI